MLGRPSSLFSLRSFSDSIKPCLPAALAASARGRCEQISSVDSAYLCLIASQRSVSVSIPCLVYSTPEEEIFAKWESSCVVDARNLRSFDSGEPYSPRQFGYIDNRGEGREGYAEEKRRKRIWPRMGRSGGKTRETRPP